MKPQTNEKEPKTGRNDPCPCASGKKYKACCALTKVSDGELRPIDDLMNEARTHHQTGRLREAREIYERVLQREPDYPEALHFLGVIAHQSGNDDVALEMMRKAIAKDDSKGVFFLNLGAVLEARGHLDQAIENYRHSVELDPGQAMGYSDLGNALLKRGNFAEAATKLTASLGIVPNNPEVINSLGVVMEKVGQFEKAAVCYRKAIALKPDYFEAYTNLSTPLDRLGKRDEAIECLQYALRLSPRFYAAHCNLGNIQRAAGHIEAALASCKTAVELQPDSVESNLNLGNAYREGGSLSKAIEYYRRVVELDPGNAGGYTNIASTFMELGRIKEAKEAFQQALDLDPHYAVAYSNMLFFHASMHDISPEAELGLARGWEKCALSEAERLAARKRAPAKGGAFPALPRTGRKLRVGVVSAELGTHAVAEFLEPFLEQLDRSRFHLTLFPTAPRSDARAERLRTLADGFVSLVVMPYAQAANRIRAEQIDILMDTTGHTNQCHLQIFAHRAAPVQLTYIGYWCTTGLTEMDWFLVDHDMPAYCEQHFSEGLWRLPNIATCYRGDTTLPDNGWKPGDTIRIGSFNKFSKIREQTLALWAKVLAALPQTKLFLEDRTLNEDETHRRILGTLAGHGVGAERVEFHPAISNHREHMLLYDQLDIALDTIPFNSGTTAMDALWMCVPLVVLEGNWSGGRIAGSALRALGRAEWIAQSDEEYVSIVRSLVEDDEGRKELRRTQRARMSASPLCDAKGLSLAIGDAFEAMYDRWLESPIAFTRNQADGK